MREVNLDLSILDLYSLQELVSSVAEEFGFNFRKMKSALLVAQITDDYRFAETVAVNRGYLVRLFDDINEAKVWLLNS